MIIESQERQRIVMRTIPKQFLKDGIALMILKNRSEHEDAIPGRHPAVGINSSTAMIMKPKTNLSIANKPEHRNNMVAGCTGAESTDKRQL